MEAEQLRKSEERSRQKHERERAAKARREVVAGRSADSRWLRDKYDAFLHDLTERIKAQSAKCGRISSADRYVCVDFTLSHAVRSGVRDRLSKDLPGFRFREEYIPGGTENMGDFNAPCMVEYGPSISLYVSWDK